MTDDGLIKFTAHLAVAGGQWSPYDSPLVSDTKHMVDLFNQDCCQYIIATLENCPFQKSVTCPHLLLSVTAGVLVLHGCETGTVSNSMLTA